MPKIPTRKELELAQKLTTLPEREIKEKAEQQGLKLLVRSAEADIFQKGKQIIRIIRNNQKFPRNLKKIFYIHEIAHELFPTNIIKYKAAMINKNQTIYYSDYIPMTLEHEKVAEEYSGYYTTSYQRIIKLREDEEKGKYKQQIKLNETPEYKQLIQKMEQAGIKPNSGLVNRGLNKKGQITFFEMDAITPDKVRQYIKNQPQQKQEKINKLLTRLEKINK